jgi:glycosyltransferase involved in cell wall biosynthesis
MRILLTAHRYYPVAGGTERLVQTLAEGIARRGHEAVVVTQREPGTAAVEERAGVRIRRIPTRWLDGIRYPQGYLRTLRGLRPDLLHVHGNRIWCADFYFPFARVFRWPQVLTGHGFYQYAIHPTAADRWYFERYLPWAADGFDVYAALTEHEAGQLAHWGLDPRKLATVPNGIALGEFQTRTPSDAASARAAWGLRAPFVAVYVGGFFENKRVDRLVDAVARTNGRWGLIAIGRDVAGSPYGLEYCAARARSRGVEFRALGELSRPAVVDAIHAADAVVLGSSYEGYGLLLLEALAAGRPFVAWASGAAPELARATGAGETVTSIEDFAAALARLEEPSVRSDRSSRARAAAPDYSDERMIDRYLAIYDRAIASRRS